MLKREMKNRNRNTDEKNNPAIKKDMGISGDHISNNSNGKNE